MSYRAGFAYFVLAVLTVLLLTQALVQATRLTAAGGLPMMGVLCAGLFFIPEHRQCRRGRPGGAYGTRLLIRWIVWRRRAWVWPFLQGP